MLQSGALEQAAELRAAITRIEGGRNARASRGPVSMGGYPALDAALGGGIKMGSLNEILPASPGDMAAACGFALALAARLAGADAARTVLWIIEDFAAQEHGLPYGPGLAQHGLAPQHLVIVRVPRRQEALWALETALKTPGTVVLGEFWAQQSFYGLTASRRLALAAQASGSPGLMLHAGLARAGPSAAALRLEIAAHASAGEASAAQKWPLPGPPAWSVRVARARAGPGVAAHDPDRRHLVAWNPEQGGFCDALPLPPSAQPGHRPHPAPAPRLARSA